jgi:hypothetical protein
MINLRHQISTKMKIDKRLLRVFIPCTEEQAEEVYKLLELAGLTGLTDVGLTDAKEWHWYCTGVKCYHDGTFQCFKNNMDYTILTIEQLRQIVNESTK